MSTARRRRRGDRPPALGEDGLHADHTRNGLAAPEEIGAARSLVHAYRTHGHMAARLDPLGSDPIGDPALDPGLPRPRATTRSSASRPRRSTSSCPGETLADALPRLRETYAGPIAYQIEHLSGHRQRLWLREAIESGAYTQPLPPDERRHILDRLLRVETFEHYLHRAFLGEKQFSIEGLDVMVLMLDEMIMLAAQAGIAEAVVGMAHRGRLNVLAHVLRRNYTSIMAEFEGRPGDDVIESLPVGGAGDVKYHHGARSSRAIDVVVREAGEVRVEQRRIDISLLPNPSHLEFVNPVVAGRVRALQTDQERSDAPADTSRALAITIHGDAAFPGQGVVAETLNLQSLAGYRVGGTLHVIANNQVGFTTDRARLALDALLVRSRQGLRHPDHPRQRRRRRRLPQRGAPGDGLPRALRARRADRPRRLPALRPQRDRRALVHAAAAGRAHQGAPLGRHALRAPPDRRRPHRRGRGRGPPRADAASSSPTRTTPPRPTTSTSASRPSAWRATSTRSMRTRPRATS